MLSIEIEMVHYGVPDPYRKANEYYHNHHICLREITEEEVVGNWDWKSLVDFGPWYEQNILPAFKAHNDRYEARGEAFKMTALQDALFETQAPSIRFSTNSCTCSEIEEYGASVGDESDPSDESEESNARDDGLKIT